jgi:hypothetical protein
MANYLIVVPRGNAELLDLLSVAFRGHSGFHVVVDRRLADAAREAERLALGPDEIVVAERSDRSERLLTTTSSTVTRVPVRRRVRRSSAAVRRRAHTTAPAASAW